MAPSKIPIVVNDHCALQLNLPALPSFPHPQIHYLYIKPHSPKDSSSTSDTSLFLVNLPIDCTPTHIRALFLHLCSSRTASIAFDSVHAPSVASTTTKASRKRKRSATSLQDDLDARFPWPSLWDRAVQPSGATAVVTFVDATSCSAAMAAARRASKAREGLPWTTAEIEAKVPALGSARYKAHRRLAFPDQGSLQESVDEYMAAYNEAEERRKQEEKRKRQQPDEDGFVTVARGGRVGVGNAEEGKRKLEEKKSKAQPLDGFYRWQVREKRREEESKLRRGFEEDRKRIIGMREMRQGTESSRGGNKFKPLEKRPRKVV